MLSKIARFDIFERKKCLMNIGDNLKKIREKHNMLQKQVAAELEIGYSNYNKIERGAREASVDELARFARLFGMSLDEVAYYDEQNEPKEVSINQRPGFEQVEMIGQLDEEDRKVITHMIDTMLTRKRFKEFFEQQLSAG